MEQRNELFKALAIAQGQMENAIKDSTNPHFKSKYADLAGCINAAKEPLSKNGLSVIQLVNKIENGVEVETILAHSSGQFISSHTPLIFTQNTMQAMGSAITYARRYSFAAIIGMAQEDDDGNSAGHGGGKPKSEEPKQPEKPIIPKPPQGNDAQQKMNELQNHAPKFDPTEGALADPGEYRFFAEPFKDKLMKDIPLDDVRKLYVRMRDWLEKGNVPSPMQQAQFANLRKFLIIMNIEA